MGGEGSGETPEGQAALIWAQRIISDTHSADLGCPACGDIFGQAPECALYHNKPFSDRGITPRISIQSNSPIALTAGVASGSCMAALPSDIARFLSGGKNLALVPLVGATLAHKVGLFLPHRDARTPVIEALLIEAQQLDRVI